MSAAGVSADLSQEEQEKVIAWLRERGVPKNCASCGQGERWELLPTVYRLLTSGNEQMPLVTVACGNCNNIRTYPLLAILPERRQTPEASEEPAS